MQTNEQYADEYPVEFEDGVDFLQDGAIIPHFGELYSSCSATLYQLANEHPAFKEFLINCQNRYLNGDMGDVSEEEARKNNIKFHEGLPAVGFYKSDLLDEGGILMGFSEELCPEYPENPRHFVVLLPSEDDIIAEWYERHPEEQRNF